MESTEWLQLHKEIRDDVRDIKVKQQVLENKITQLQISLAVHEAKIKFKSKIHSAVWGLLAGSVPVLVSYFMGQPPA